MIKTKIQKVMKWSKGEDNDAPTSYTYTGEKEKEKGREIFDKRNNWTQVLDKYNYLFIFFSTLSLITG